MSAWHQTYAETRIWMASARGICGVYTGHDCATDDPDEHGAHAPRECVNPLEQIFVCQYNGVVHQCKSVSLYDHPFIDTTTSTCCLGSTEVSSEFAAHDWETRLLEEAERGEARTVADHRWVRSAHVQTKTVSRSQSTRTMHAARGILPYEIRRDTEITRLRRQIEQNPFDIQLLTELHEWEMAEIPTRAPPPPPPPLPLTGPSHEERSAGLLNRRVRADGGVPVARAQKVTTKRANNLMVAFAMAKQTNGEPVSSSASSRGAGPENTEEIVTRAFKIPRRKFWYQVDPLLPIARKSPMTFSSRMQWTFGEEEEFAAASCGEPTLNIPNPTAQVPQIPLCLADYFWETFVVQHANDEAASSHRVAYSATAEAYGSIVATQLKLAASLLPPRGFGSKFQASVKPGSSSSASDAIPPPKALADARPAGTPQETRARKAVDWRPMVSELLKREFIMFRRYPTAPEDWLHRLKSLHTDANFILGLRILLCALGHWLGSHHAVSTESALVHMSNDLKKLLLKLLQTAYSASDNPSLLMFFIRELGSARSSRRIKLRLFLLENAIHSKSHTPHPLWLYQYTMTNQNAPLGGGV